MKRKIAFILMASLLSSNVAFADGNEQANINLTFDGDMFIKTSKNATSSYNDGLWYYDGSKYGTTVTLGDMTYNLSGDMDTKGNDVIKIDANDVTVALNNSALKNIGIILFSREEQQNNEITVTVNYKGGKSDSYTVKVPVMTAENDEGEGFNPIKIVRQGSRYVPTVDTSDLVYLNDEIIDTSKSVNKNLDVESVTFGATDFAYYVAAVTQVEFSATELEEQTKEAVRTLYEKYADINFLDLFEEKDGADYNEAQELYSAMLKQEGKMDVATAENIKKIENLITGYELYVEIKGYKDEVESLLGDYPEKSTDFEELSETDLTEADFENLKKLLEIYESINGFDGDAFESLVEMYGLAENIDVAINMENESKIKALHNAYEKAVEKTELREKIDGIYSLYIGKDISEIADSDLEKLAELISYFDEADALEIDFPEYDDRYILHLYEDYEVYKASEIKKPIDITGAYNIDMLGVVGELADANTWYESRDNLSGERFPNAAHAGVRSYDKKTGIMYTVESEYQENSSYDPATEITTVTYPFKDIGHDIPFYMPEEVFKTGVCDGLLLKAGEKETYTFDMSGSYSDKLYFMISAETVGNITPVVTYSDGTKENYSAYVNLTGQVVNEIRNKRKTYSDAVGYITSGDYKDQNMAKTGILYFADGNTTNGFSTFAVSLNPGKSPVSVTFPCANFNYVLVGVAEKPVENDTITKWVTDRYDEVVYDGFVDTADIKKVSEMVRFYNEAKGRGVYIKNIDDEIMEIHAPLAEIIDEGKTEKKTNSTADYKKSSLDLENDIIKIHGFTPSKQADKEVSAVVYSPEGDIIYGGIVKTNNDGYFAFDVEIPETVTTSGYMSIKIGGEDFEKAYVSQDIYFPVSADRVEAIKELNSAKNAEEIAEALKNAEKNLSLNFVLFTDMLKNEEDLNSFAERIKDVKELLPEISGDENSSELNSKIAELQGVIKKQSVFECIEQKRTEKLIADGMLLYDDVMGYSDIDKDGVTLYNLYESSLSETGKTEIINGLLGKDYKNTEDFSKEFKALIMLNALKNPKENGVGHVEVALTKENADATDMNITKYLNLKDKSKANSEIANMNMTALSDVEEYIRKLSDIEVSEKPSKGSSGGGGGSSLGGIAIVPQTENVISTESKEEKSAFNDVNKNHWAYEAIATLSEKGIINGKGNGNFDPDGTITRAEFVKILCVANNIKAEGPIYFTDVERHAWYEEYVAAAFNAGLVNGISENEFGVSLPISRQDICTILYRAKGVNEKNLLEFSDKGEVAGYAEDAIAFFAMQGVVSGFSDGTFRPLENCTRAQAAKIIYNYLNM